MYWTTCSRRMEGEISSGVMLFAAELQPFPAVDVKPIMCQFFSTRAVTIAKSQMERARTFDERLMLQKALDRAEREMNEAAMQVNRGLDRAAPTA